MAIGPLEDGLCMSMLRDAEELRKPEDFFDEVPSEKPSKEMIDLAVQLITQKIAVFKPEKFEDHRRREKQANQSRRGPARNQLSWADAIRRTLADR